MLFYFERGNTLAKNKMSELLLLLFYFAILMHDGGCCCCLFEKGGQKNHFEYAHDLMIMQIGGMQNIHP